MTKRWLPFLIIYVLVHTAGGDVARSYEGLSQVTIDALLTAEGNTRDVMTKANYDAFVIAHQPAPLTPSQQLAQFRSVAIDELNTDSSGNSKVIRAVFLVELDEINLIRSLLVPAQTPRTITQFKNAVQTKITSGAAD